MIKRSYSDQIISFYPEVGMKACRNITFQITEDCCLNCSYCYQINKSKKKMSKETAKKAVDLLFKMYEDNNPDAYINKDTHGIILDFIGGEPLMNIEIMDYIVSYFIQQCIEKNHEWLTTFRVGFASNGILYFEEEVQNFFKKYSNFISMTISIDGPKEIHDACRIDYDGKGSFERSFAALEHYLKNYGKYMSIEDNTKITIAPENLPYLNKIIDFFLKYNVSIIYANPIYENKWTIEQAKEYYKQLKILANKMLEHPEIQCSRFLENNYRPKTTNDNQNWCGGTGAMLAFDPDGIAYPCIRYMGSSLGQDQKPLIVGNVENGIYNNDETIQIKKELNAITRRSQSTDECFHCPIAAGCAWCSAWNYQENGTPNKRSTNICWMHRAEALANVYYWNLRYRKEKSEKRFPMYLQQQEALKIIGEEEYNELLLLTFNDRY